MNDGTTADQPQPPTPTNDGVGEVGAISDPQFVARVERAAAEATATHLSESRGRGKRGPDKRPRKPRAVPGEKMGNGTTDPFFQEDPPAPLENGWDAAPAFDEEVARSLVDIAVGLLNDGAAAIIRAVAKKETGDDLLAAEAAASVRMTEKVESAVKKGAMECAKKYAVRLDYAPEIMLGGGLLIWAGQVVVVKKSLTEKGAELRAHGEQLAA